MMHLLLGKRRIECLGGLVEYPLPVGLRQRGERAGGEFEKLRERTFRGRKFRAPGEPRGTELRHQQREEAFRRRLALTRLDEASRRELQIDRGNLCELEQAAGRRVGMA